MGFYTYLIFMGLGGIGLSAYCSFRVSDPGISFISTVLSYILSIVITFIITKREIEGECSEIIDDLKKEQKTKILRLKREHDTTTLERTIRDGTKTLIKNAVDYFKIENIKNEMPSSAAIQNLQLDKYGQIIELLADFSLILPDRKENQEIVQQEINHQIDIYRTDEKSFAFFLQRIMEKYLITVSKKIREKKELNAQDTMKRCPRCAEKVLAKAKICKHCGHEFRDTRMVSESDPFKKGETLYRSGDFKQALNFFNNAVNLNPKSSRAYYNRGITYEKLGNPAQAKNDLMTAAQLGHKRAQKILDLQGSADAENGKKEDKTKIPLASVPVESPGILSVGEI